jgi:hypothetical protein
MNMREQFKSLSDPDLLTKTASAARSEKAATLTLLEHLAEVDDRRAYAILSYSSLFDYATRGLGYSESQASERVNAVRLMRQNDGVREHLHSGALSLTAAAQIQRFVVAEKKHAESLPAAERNLVIEACLNQSRRQVEKILFEKSSEPAKIASKERVRAVSREFHEIRFLVNEEQMQALERSRELFPDDALASLMERALKLLISQKEKQMGRRNPDSKGETGDAGAGQVAEKSVRDGGVTDAPDARGGYQPILGFQQPNSLLRRQCNLQGQELQPGAPGQRNQICFQKSGRRNSWPHAISPVNSSGSFIPDPADSASLSQRSRAYAAGRAQDFRSITSFRWLLGVKPSPGTCATFVRRTT